MRSLLLSVALATFAVLAASAQQMPDLSQMAGVPLPAPELANGTVTVRLMREQIGNNIAGHPVSLKTPQGIRAATTDAQGRAQFSGLAAGTAVEAGTVVDGETLTSQQFNVPPSGGVRVALIAGLKAASDRERAAAEAAAKEPARPGIVTIAGNSRIILEFQDDNLQVFYLLDIVNGARTPIDTGNPLVMELPGDATGATLMEGSSRLAAVHGDRVTITGPFPPGVTSLQVGYTLRYSGDAATINQSWPAAVEQVFVAAEKVGDLRLSSPQLPQQQEGESSGQKFVMGRGARLNTGQTLTLTLTGLPHYNHIVRNVGVGLAVLILAIGLWAGLTGAPARKGHVAQLEARKEKLFKQLVELEQQRTAGRVDDKRYAAKRQALMTDLERVLGELDRAPSGGGEGLAA